MRLWWDDLILYWHNLTNAHESTNGQQKPAQNILYIQCCLLKTFAKGGIEHPRYIWVDSWNLGLSWVGYRNFYNIYSWPFHGYFYAIICDFYLDLYPMLSAIKFYKIPHFLTKLLFFKPSQVLHTSRRYGMSRLHLASFFIFLIWYKVFAKHKRN